MPYFSKERNTRLAAKLFDHIRNTTTDRLDDFFEYDLSIYSCPEVAARERTQIFERVPMMAAHSHQLPEPGTFLTVSFRTNPAVHSHSSWPGSNGPNQAPQHSRRIRSSRGVTSSWKIPTGCSAISSPRGCPTKSSSAA